jgi:membrane-associated phospholipid phosphatase
MHWDAHIRATLLDIEWLTQLEFGVAGQTATLASRALGGRPIVAITRPGRAAFEAQLALVESWASRREEYLPEIVSQQLPQLAHWASILHLQPQRHRHTIELIETALRFAMGIVMRFKHALNCPRPSEYSPNVQPLIPVPGYSTLPSGHATEAHMAACVLLALTGQTPPGPIGAVAQASPLRLQLMRLAARIADRRVVAGLHFPLDSAAGQALAFGLADYFVALATGAQGRKKAPIGRAWRFDGTAADPLQDWSPAAALGSADPPAPFGATAYTGALNGRAPLLAQLWQRARAEQAGAGFC